MTMPGISYKFKSNEGSQTVLTGDYVLNVDDGYVYKRLSSGFTADLKSTVSGGGINYGTTTSWERIGLGNGRHYVSKNGIDGYALEEIESIDVATNTTIFKASLVDTKSIGIKKTDTVPVYDKNVEIAQCNGTSASRYYYDAPVTVCTFSNPLESKAYKMVVTSGTAATGYIRYTLTNGTSGYISLSNGTYYFIYNADSRVLSVVLSTGTSFLYSISNVQKIDKVDMIQNDGYATGYVYLYSYDFSNSFANTGLPLKEPQIKLWVQN